MLNVFYFSRYLYLWCLKGGGIIHKTNVIHYLAAVTFSMKLAFFACMKFRDFP